MAGLIGAAIRSIITTLNARRTVGLVLYDTDRALLTGCDIAAPRAIADAAHD
jgi:CRP/FNR family transcriptional regulator, cyclic AMP receptor protein